MWILIIMLLCIAHAQDVPEGWKLVWNDEFYGPKIDESKWTFETGTQNGNGPGWGNKELQYYTDDGSNAFIEDGKLVIQAKKEEKEGSQYTSARMKTQGKFSTTYGRIEASLKLPAGKGLRPAFWMLGDNVDEVGWPACGEIDIMEWVGKDPNNVHGSIHEPEFDTSSKFSSEEGWSNYFHKYELVWQKDLIEISVDNNVYATVTPDDTNGEPFVFNDNPMFLLLNLAVGGNWPGSPDESTEFPQQLVVDYVRIYKMSVITSSKPKKKICKANSRRRRL